MSCGSGLRRPGLAAAGIAALLAIGIGGCGGTAISGRRVFAEHCQVCHSISGHSSPVQQGGDLRGVHLPRSELTQFTAEMPPINGRLSGAEIRAVVSYLQAMERRR